MIKKSKSELEDISQDSNPKKLSNNEMQEILIENFVGLQRAMTNLAVKFESLSDQINKLLEIFELSARNFMRQGGEKSPEETKDILNKIDSLLSQNKTIAKGLVLLEEQLKPDTSQNPAFPRQQYQKAQMMPSILNQQMQTRMPEEAKPKIKPLPTI